jgi:hypothetical protein
MTSVKRQACPLLHSLSPLLAIVRGTTGLACLGWMHFGDGIDAEAVAVNCGAVG